MPFVAINRRIHQTNTRTNLRVIFLYYYLFITIRINTTLFTNFGLFLHQGFGLGDCAVLVGFWFGIAFGYVCLGVLLLDMLVWLVDCFDWWALLCSFYVGYLLLMIIFVFNILL
jgi:hypothetical protein